MKSSGRPAKSKKQRGKSGCRRGPTPTPTSMAEPRLAVVEESGVAGERLRFARRFQRWHRRGSHIRRGAACCQRGFESWLCRASAESVRSRWPSLVRFRRRRRLRRLGRRCLPGTVRDLDHAVDAVVADFRWLIPFRKSAAVTTAWNSFVIECEGWPESSTFKVKVKVPFVWPARQQTLRTQVDSVGEITVDWSPDIGRERRRWRGEERGSRRLPRTGVAAHRRWSAEFARRADRTTRSQTQMRQRRKRVTNSRV